ncbi:phosphate ABC transporter substrate-binding protein PstS family protein [Rosistilla oblonga]|uniref:PstS family phosphate ABC transporter substrate-binding protein n=1 Tax=Rosistilla oblonga TaxID=2527990 RepID=UPI003A96BE64
MRQTLGRTTLTAMLCIGFLTVAGCGSKKSGGDSDAGGAVVSDGEAVSQLTGKIAVEGSSTVSPITTQAKERFNEQHPDVTISITGEGTSNGFKSFAKKETDIQDASRPIKQKELDTCNESGLEFIEVPVAYDGLTIAVHPKNKFVKSLTVDQLKKIFRSGDSAKTWKEVDPQWPDKKISIFSPGTGSGTYDYFSEVVIGKEGSLRDDNQINLNEDDNILVRGVAGDEFAIGYFGYSYYDRNKNDLQAVPIINPAGEAVLPNAETIESGEYAPFSRPLFIYLNSESLDKVEVEIFVESYMTNIREIVAAANYVPLPESVYTAATQNIENRVAGTHYLTAEGEKREGSIINVFKPENLKK